MDKLLKLINKHPVLKNILKVGALGSWIMYLAIAYTSTMLIEAFLLSTLMVVIGYFIFRSRHNRTSGKKNSYRRNKAETEPIRSEHYLKVFF